MDMLIELAWGLPAWAAVLGPAAYFARETKPGRHALRR